MVRQVLEGGQVALTEYLPKEIVDPTDWNRNGMQCGRFNFPKNEEVMRRARNRIVFDEFLLFVLGVRRLKEHPGTVGQSGSLWWRCRRPAV